MAEKKATTKKSTVKKTADAIKTPAKKAPVKKAPVKKASPKKAVKKAVKKTSLNKNVNEAKPVISQDQFFATVSEAAYFSAQNDGNKKSSAEYWLEAEEAVRAKFDVM
ncbi:MAG: hypothetical protein PWQ29_988 [Verrucomicrobiota bacterium]|jgi:hypothetical protein|nr:hypothetical protein [Verrucomicrobiota bacterium]MDK2963594.1 hypothetical protein [Verrucomicrobiota bacterium]